ncbi:MAG TPA: hypothetical protein VI874_03305, partial [Candidatus Norongarragalinales archaeon]|nr:hypothetical protein [Candidatus Norongarragalinales archaeon]
AEMGNFEKRLVQSFEAQADALCGRCSAQVREPVMNALSAVFVRDFSRADEKLVQARAIFESEKKAAQEKETSAQELEKQKAELSFAELDLFEKAFAGVSMKGDPERLSLDQTRTSAKKRFDRLKGQNLAQDKFQAERSLFQDERKILSDAVASVRESASLTLESARKAQTQFGDDSSQRALHAIEASFSEGRFSAAQEAASRLIAQMQKTQPVQKTGLFSGNATEWLIGVFAFFALAGLVYYFRFRNAPVKLEEI